MAVFAENHLLHTEQLPLGGLHVTRDIASVLSTTVTAAERLKTLWGSALVSPDDEREMLPVPLVGEDEHHIAKVPRSMIVNIIRPRLEETFDLVRQRLDASGLGRVAGHRVVLTGGAIPVVVDGEGKVLAAASRVSSGRVFVLGAAVNAGAYQSSYFYQGVSLEWTSSAGVRQLLRSAANWASGGRKPVRLFALTEADAAAASLLAATDPTLLKVVAHAGAVTTAWLASSADVVFGSEWTGMAVHDLAAVRE
jgi:cell division ATPase FtsA